MARFHRRWYQTATYLVGVFGAARSTPERSRRCLRILRTSCGHTVQALFCDGLRSAASRARGSFTLGRFCPHEAQRLASRRWFSGRLAFGRGSLVHEQDRTSKVSYCQRAKRSGLLECASDALANIQTLRDLRAEQHARRFVATMAGRYFQTLRITNSLGLSGDQIRG